LNSKIFYSYLNYIGQFKLRELNNNNIHCKICNKKFEKLTSSHVKTHGLNLNDYRLLFGIEGKDYKQCEYISENYHRDPSFAPHRCTLHIPEESETNYCILHLENNDKDASLFEKSLSALINLYDGMNSEYHLEGIIFPVEFHFNNKELQKSIYLSGSQFLHNVSIRAIFYEKAIFDKCIFHHGADFRTSKFCNYASFFEVAFKKTVVFNRAIFSEDTTFWNAEFLERASFHQTTFKKRVYFAFGIFPTVPNVMIFVATRFRSPKDVLFSGVDLSATLFRFTDLTYLFFNDVKWPLTSRLKAKRRYIYDEIIIEKEKDNRTQYSKNQLYAYAKVAYQQLKRNFEERRDFSLAGDFYYGEMECIRKSKLLRRYLPSFVNLYRISSGYGQKYIRAGIVMILLLLVFSISHLFLGLKPTNPNSYLNTINYSFNNLSINYDNFIYDLLISTNYCIEVITREEEQDRMFRPIYIWGEIINPIFSILIYVQVLFFVLALRRHFKR